MCFEGFASSGVPKPCARVYASHDCHVVLEGNVRQLRRYETMSEIPIRLFRSAHFINLSSLRIYIPELWVHLTSLPFS